MSPSANIQSMISGMNMIDCCFSPLVATVNMLLKHVGSNASRSVAIMNRIPAEVVEMEVQPNAVAANRKIADIDCPRDAVFAIIIRDNVLVPAVGNQELIGLNLPLNS